MLELELGSGRGSRSGSGSSDAATLTTKSISPTVTNAISPTVTNVISPDKSLGATSDIAQVCDSWHYTKRFRVYSFMGEVGLGLGLGPVEVR